jgi:hypothetical protein
MSEEAVSSAPFGAASLVEAVVIGEAADERGCPAVAQGDDEDGGEQAKHAFTTVFTSSRSAGVPSTHPTKS